jgi:hypothetical protein
VLELATILHTGFTLDDGPLIGGRDKYTLAPAYHHAGENHLVDPRQHFVLLKRCFQNAQSEPLLMKEQDGSTCPMTCVTSFYF